MPGRISRKLQRIQRWLIWAVAGLVVVVLFLSLASRAVVTRSRAEGDYRVVENLSTVQPGESGSGDAEYRFTLDKVGRGETLAFFVNHSEVSVCIGGESVYTLTAAQDGVFVTSGGIWVMIPLYESDSGKEVCVRLAALYDNYHGTPEFLLGSEVAVHNATLHRALPALVLSLCNVIVGLLLISFAVYRNIRKLTGSRMYALGAMAISAGVWRFSYDRIAYLLFAENAVFVYTLSVVSLMSMALAMINSMETEEKGARLIRLCSCGYCAVYIAQLLMQAVGAADLRQTLTAVHLTIFISAVLFVADGVRRMLRPRAERQGRNNFGWVLGVGVAGDLFMYYFAEESFRMVLTLVAILCYSVIEGVHILVLYIEQQNTLEEMETQLTLSRTTTMMSQIRSHFVFNLLNAISGMCKYDPELADETIVRFARYLRSNIDIMESDRNIPFSTDLRQLEDYVALEQVRFGDKIEFYTDIETEDFFIPPLILQPVVENAIKHGISKKQGNGTIILRTRRGADGSAVITVEDDGVGFAMAELDKGQSVGIRNIRFRLAHLVGGTLDIRSEIGKGTSVTITIPKENIP